MFLNSKEERNRQIFLERKHEGTTYRKLADKYGISVERARSIYIQYNRKVMREKALLKDRYATYCFSVRTINCLKSIGVEDIRQLQEFDARRLLKIRNFGKFSLKEVEDRMKSLGLKLKEYVCPYCNREK